MPEIGNKMTLFGTIARAYRGIDKYIRSSKRALMARWAQYSGERTKGQGFSLAENVEGF